MIVVAFVAIAVVSVPLSGRRLIDVVHLPVRGGGLIVGGFTVQLVAVSLLPSERDGVARWLHIASYVAAAVFVWINRRIPWMWLVGAGGALNALAIAANGGVMPASHWAYRTAGLAARGDSFANSRPLDGPRLLWLGDVLAIPKGWPLANVFSVGDLVLVVGLTVLLHTACGVRREREREHRVPRLVDHGSLVE